MLSRLLRMFIGDPGDPEILDHVPVCGAPDWHKAKIEEARQRFGKPFAPELKTARVTAPSHILQHITRQTEDAKRLQRTNVSQIKPRKKS